VNLRPGNWIVASWNQHVKTSEDEASLQIWESRRIRWRRHNLPRSPWRRRCSLPRTPSSQDDEGWRTARSDCRVAELRRIDSRETGASTVRHTPEQVRTSATQIILRTWQTRNRSEMPTHSGATTAEKLRGTKVWVPTPGRLQRPGWVLGAGGGRTLYPFPLWGSGGITPGIFLKTQMLNPAFWWLLAVQFLAFWKLRPRRWGENALLLGWGTSLPCPDCCCAYASQNFHGCCCVTLIFDSWPWKYNKLFLGLKLTCVWSLVKIVIELWPVARKQTERQTDMVAEILISWNFS